MTKSKQKSHQQGMMAEWLALMFLRLKGYRLLERRYKTTFGEIDLIVRRGDVLVGVEVKYRKTIEDGLHSILPRQCQRIENAMRMYMTTLTWKPETIRFDVVCLAPHAQPVHLENAWGY